MMMYHSVQSQRQARAKGMKVKHLVQLVVLTVLFTWFLYQLNSLHKAKVVSQQKVKERGLDEELLISADIENLTISETFNTVGRSEEDDLLLDKDDLIDKNSLDSVLKSRILGPPDMLELEQTTAEEDRVEDVDDDSGEGDRDDQIKTDDQVRLAGEPTSKTKGQKIHKGRSAGIIETVEDPVEDEMGKDYGGSGQLTPTKLRGPVEEDTLIYNIDERKGRGTDAPGEHILVKFKRMIADPDEKMELAPSTLPNHRQKVELFVDGKKFTDLDDTVMDQEITPTSAGQPANPASKFDRFEDGASMMSNMRGRTISRSVGDFNRKRGDDTMSLQKVAEALGVPRSGAREGLDSEATVRDGHNSLLQNVIVEPVSEDQPVQAGNIFEVVSAGENTQSVPEDVISQARKVDGE